MPEIKLKIEGKIVSQVGDNPPIVCGNDDYECVVEFDEEWSGHALKVAKIIWNGIYEEVTFGGDRFTLPKVFNTTKVKVGFYAGDLRTTTGVTLGALRSINDENPRHEEEPSEDIVNRILRLIEEGAIQGPQGIQGTPGFFISDYSANPPVPGLIHGFKIEDLYPPMEPKVGELIMSYGNFGIYRVEAVMNGGCIGRCTGSFRGDDYVLTDEDRAEIARAASELVNKQSLGLGNVDNTADADKPISKAADSRFKKIEEKIPAAASTSNPLTDKDTVAKMISDRIVDFKGTFSATNLLPMGGVTDGDLAFVTRTDADGNDILDLYMFDGSRRIWVKKTEIYSNKFTAEDFVRIRNAYIKPQNGIPDDDLERDLKERIGYVDPNGTLIDSDIDFGYLQDNIAGLGYVHLPNMIKDAEYNIVVTGKNNFRFEGTGFARENNPIEAVFHNYIIVDNEGCVFVYGSEFPPENAPYHVKLTGPKIIHQKYNPLQTVRDGTAGFTTEMGKDTVATGSFAVAEGWETEALNEFAHAMGNHTKAKAAASLAAGMYTETEDTAMAGMAQGYRTIATGAFQHVEGRYNVRDNEGRYAHIVGAGVADNDRENIEAIDWDGNKKIRGDVYVHANADSSGGDKLATEKHVNEVVDDKLANADFDAYATKEELAALNRRVDFQMELSQGQTWDVETDSNEAYEKTLPSGVKMGEVTEIGGRSIVENQLYSGGHESIPTTSGSKYLKQVSGVESIVTGDGTDIEFGSVGKSPAFEVDIPETAKQARVDMIAGRSIVLNQLNDHEGSDVPSVSGSKYLKKTHGVKSIVTGDGNPIETAERAASPMSSATIPANVDKANVFGIGGRSFKWNQRIDLGFTEKKSSTTPQGWMMRMASYEKLEANTFTYSGNAGVNAILASNYGSRPRVYAGHKYLVCSTITSNLELYRGYRAKLGDAWVYVQIRTGTKTYGIIQEVTEERLLAQEDIRIGQMESAQTDLVLTASRPNMLDLTSAFGPGNEPTTVDAAIAAYRALGIDITQPQPYDPGSIKHTAVTEVVTRGVNILDIVKFAEDTQGLSYDPVTRTVSSSISSTSIVIYSNENDYQGRLKFSYTMKSSNNTFYFNITYTDDTSENKYTSSSANRAGFTTADGKVVKTVMARVSVGGALKDLMIMELGNTSDVYTPYRTPITQPIPASVLALDGYGWSAGTASNHIYRDGNKWWYKKEVGAVDLGTKYWITYAQQSWRSCGVFNTTIADKATGYNTSITASFTNTKNSDAFNFNYAAVGKYTDHPTLNTVYFDWGDTSATVDDFKRYITGQILYYVLATPLLTDITNLMGDTFAPVDVEEGGSVTLVSETGADVPADIRFIDSTDTLLDMTRTLGSDAPSILEDVPAAYKKVGVNPDYQTEHNPGSIVNTSVEDVRYSDSSQQIPDAVLELPGYGWSAGTASNKIIRRGDRWVYRQEVDRVDMGSLKINGPINLVKGPAFYSKGLVGRGLNATFILAPYTNANSSGNLNDRMVFYAPGDSLYIRDDRFATAAELKTHLLGHYGYFILATPLETDITGLMTGVLEPRDLTAADTTLTFSSNTGAEVENEVSFYDKTDHLVDLTRMFGSSKEPTTPAAFHSLLPAYDFAHHPGSINSAAVNKVVWRGKNLCPPQITFSKASEFGFGGSYYYWKMPIGDSTSGWVCVRKKNGVDIPTNLYLGISKPGNARWFINASQNPGTIGTEDRPINGDQYLMVYPASYAANVLDYVDVFITTQYTTSSNVPNFVPYRTPIEQPIPQAILDLPGYGWSAGSAYNRIYLDADGKWWYRQEVDKLDTTGLKLRPNERDSNSLLYLANESTNVYYLPNAKSGGQCFALGFDYSEGSYPQTAGKMTLFKASKGIIVYFKIRTAMTIDEATAMYLAGNTIYYELAEPALTDITDLMLNALESVKIEAGGTVTFENTNGPDFKIAVPNATEYIVKLSEV